MSGIGFFLLRRWRLVMVLLAGLFASWPAVAIEDVRLGFLYSSRPELGRAETRAVFDLWVQEFMSQHKLSLKVDFYDDMAQMRTDFLSQKINFVVADGMSLARHFKPEELRDGFATMIDGGFNLVMVTVTSGPVRRMDDLVGRRVVLAQNDTTSETYLASLCLVHYRRPCSQVFSEVERVPNGNQAIMRTFFGKADAALVYRFRLELAGEMNPQVRNRLSGVLADYPLDGLFFGYPSSASDASVNEKGMAAVLAMHKSPRGRQIMELFKINQFRTAKPSELRPFIQMDRDYRTLLAKWDNRGGSK